MTKTLVGDPVENGDGTWTIDYDLTVANAGAADARYDLSDTIRFGAGATVVDGGRHDRRHPVPGRRSGLVERHVEHIGRLRRHLVRGQFARLSRQP